MTKGKERKDYIRDGRAPVPDSEQTSRTMSAIRGKHTKPELNLRKALREAGMSGYRLHWSKAPGNPDIVYPGKKLAIFVHGCYWHRCPHCNPSFPKSHKDFWAEKFQKNQERDERKIRELESMGWKVLVVWECQLKRNMNEVVQRIKENCIDR